MRVPPAAIKKPLFVISACRQFPAEWAVAGKPIENTYEECKASPQAAIEAAANGLITA